MFICRAVPYDLFLQGALPFSIIPRSAMPLAKARTPFVLVPRTYSQPSNLPCPKEGFDLNPQPLSPLQGRGLKKKSQLAVDYFYVLVLRDDAMFFSRLPP